MGAATALARRGMARPHLSTRAIILWSVLTTVFWRAASQVVPQMETQGSLDALGINDHVRSREASLCGAKCADIWLDPTGLPKVMTSTVSAAGTVRPTASVNATEECFPLINATCFDCRTVPPPPATFATGAVCTHAYFRTDPQPISGHFSFCSGFAAASAAEMSHIAWRRFIGWRSLTCHPPSADANDGSEYDALRKGRGLPDADRKRYYRAGTSGWRHGVEAQLEQEVEPRSVTTWIDRGGELEAEGGRGNDNSPPPPSPSPPWWVQN